MFLLTSADFVLPQLETSVRSTASRNDLNLFFLEFEKGRAFDKFFQ